MQPRNKARPARDFVLCRDWRDRRSFLDSRVAAFLADARYSRSGAACTWKPDYARLRHESARNKPRDVMRIDPTEQRNP